MLQSSFSNKMGQLLALHNVVAPGSSTKITAKQQRQGSPVQAQVRARPSALVCSPVRCKKQISSGEGFLLLCMERADSLDGRISSW